MREKIYRTISISVIMVLLVCNIRVFSMEVVSGDEISASENATVEEGTNDDVDVSDEVNTDAVSENNAESFTVQTDSVDNEIISVMLPTVEVGDTFSFFIDPQNILYNSYADSDDVYVEEGVHMLFINRAGGGYSLSGSSDKLDIVNRSTVPVEITAKASLENIDNINVLDSRDIGDSNTCDMYLALVDDEGNEYPLSADGEVSFTVRLDKAPIDAYAYEYDEESGEYVYASQLSDVAFDSFSMGLTGDCSATDNWADINVNPVVRISWSVEPVIEDTEISEDISGDEESDEEELEDVDSVSQNEADIDEADIDDTGDESDSDDSEEDAENHNNTVSDSNIPDTGIVSDNNADVNDTDSNSVSDNNADEGEPDSPEQDNDDTDDISGDSVSDNNAGE